MRMGGRGGGREKCNFHFRCVELERPLGHSVDVE